jgi:hypothetical protein
MSNTSVTIEIFDPPMCCPGGLCGPTLDPALLDIQEAILKISEEFDGRVSVHRYLLGQQPAKFMQQPEVIVRLKTEGIGVLPLTVVNGRVVHERAYPTYEALRGWVDAGVEG